MKYVTMVLLAVLLCVVSVAPVAATSVSDAEFKAAQSLYETVRTTAKESEAMGEWQEAYELHLQAAKVTPFRYVRAWRLNSAAYILITEMGKDENGNATKGNAEKALALLGEAEGLVDLDRAADKPSARAAVASNKLYCERVLGLKAWPK